VLIVLEDRFFKSPGVKATVSSPFDTVDKRSQKKNLTLSPLVEQNKSPSVSEKELEIVSCR